MAESKDFSPNGLKLEGAWENDRNAASADLFKSVLRECFGERDVIIAHHLVYVAEEHRTDGLTYQVVEEIPSADTMIFSHQIAKRVFGEGKYLEVLARLAQVPAEQRDALYAQLYAAREK